jgi:orotate phosphoribosyltransferase
MTHFVHSSDAREIARQTAKMLLEIEAVMFMKDKPFVFTSGRESPVYTDCRKIISYPRLRSALMDFAVATMVRDVGYEKFDVVAGGETAGIPFAAWVSDRLALPMQYVRKKPKGFGRNAQIEGNIVEGQRALLVEDLASDGGSKLGFVKAIRDAGMVCEHCFVIFYYDIFPNAKKALDDLGVTLHRLATWWDVLEVAKAGGYFDTKTIDEVERFLHNPADWSASRGGGS